MNDSIILEFFELDNVIDCQSLIDWFFNYNRLIFFGKTRVIATDYEKY